MHCLDNPFSSQSFVRKRKFLNGDCGKEVRVKVWKQGHSFRCIKGSYPRTEIRYWKPTPSIEEELKEFCRGCKEKLVK